MGCRRGAYRRSCHHPPPLQPYQWGCRRGAYRRSRRYPPPLHALPEERTGEAAATRRLCTPYQRSVSAKPPLLAASARL